MNTNDELTMKIITASTKHTHVNVINTFAQLGAAALHQMPMDKMIDDFINEYESIIITLKQIQGYTLTKGE